MPSPARRRLVAGGAVLAIVAGAALWWVVTRPSNDVCDGEIGPSALVAVDAATGERLWTRLVGSASWQTMTIEGDRVDLETYDHELAVAAESGDLVRCVDVGARDVPVRATTGPRDNDDVPLPEPDVEVGDGARLEVLPEGSVNRQERHITVREDSGEVRWSRTIPGFEVHLVGGLVVSIDQTGGTGHLNPFGPDTRITAYDFDDGAQIWQVALPGTPYEAIAAGDLIIAPGGTSLFGIDAASGAIRWEVDHGSPGQNRKYSYAGEYGRLLATADEQVVIGFIAAAAPYRD